MIALLSLLAFGAWTGWTLLHWLYLFAHFVAGPLAVWVAWRKGNRLDSGQSVVLLIFLFLTGIEGLIFAALSARPRP